VPLEVLSCFVLGLCLRFSEFKLVLQQDSNKQGLLGKFGLGDLRLWERFFQNLGKNGNISTSFQELCIRPVKEGMEWYQEDMCLHVCGLEPVWQQSFHVAPGRVHKCTLKTSRIEGSTTFVHNCMLRVNFAIC